MNQYRIFSVDDDDDDSEFLKEAFDKSGSAPELKQFFTYQDLFQYMETLPDTELPHLVILENQVKGIDGGSAVEQIRRDPRYAGVKLAIYYSCVPNSTLADYSRQGVDMCLHKSDCPSAIQEDVRCFVQVSAGQTCDRSL